MEFWKEDGEPVGGAARPRGPLYWAEIEDVLAGRNSMARRPPRRDKWLPDHDCPLCGKPMQPLYFANGDQCWKSLCGRAGWILICRPCHAWSEMMGTFTMS